MVTLKYIYCSTDLAIPIYCEERSSSGGDPQDVVPNR